MTYSSNSQDSVNKLNHHVLPVNKPKELFKWSPPKRNSWIEEYYQKHRTLPLNKIKLKYLEFYIMDVTEGEYYANHNLFNDKNRPRSGYTYTWEILIESIKKEGLKNNIRIYCETDNEGGSRFKVIDGNHRCNVLSYLYGMDYEVECSLEYNYWGGDIDLKPVTIDVKFNPHNVPNKHVKNAEITSKVNSLIKDKVHKLRVQVQDAATKKYNGINTSVIKRINTTYKDFH